MNVKSILLALALAASASFAAADTSLILKPTPAQIKAAVALDNKECPVSKEPNGSMGAGKTVIYKGKAVTLCCGSCVKKFAKDPAKFVAMAEKSSMPAPVTPAPAKPLTGHEGHNHD